MSKHKHDGHHLVLVREDVVVETRAVLTEEGNVSIFGPTLVVEQEGDGYVYCVTCSEALRHGEDGLAYEWEVE